MLKVAAFLGSPRPQGNNALLLAELLQGMESTGKVAIEQFLLAKLQINPCLACNGCAQSGVCVQRDDMTAVYHALSACDIFVLAAPIFFSGLSAQAKLMIDRCQPYWALKYVMQQDAFAGHRRLGFLLSTCGQLAKFQQFKGAEQVMGTFYHLLGMRSAGSILLADIDRLPAAERAEDLAAVRRQGRKVVAQLSSI